MSCLKPIKVIHPRRRSGKWRDHMRELVRNGDVDSLRYEYETTPRHLEVPCGRCSECRRKRASAWRTRLLHEHIYGGHSNGLFVTLTIAPEHYDDAPEDLVPQYMRIFWENYRELFKDPITNKRPPIPTHWFVTELGDDKGRLHLHGIIWDSAFYVSPKAFDKVDLIVRYSRKGKRLMNAAEQEAAHAISMCWPFGSMNFVGYEVSARSMCYVTKYITKEIQYDPAFVSRVYCSPGIGKCSLDAGLLRSYIRRCSLEHNLTLVPADRKKEVVPRYYLSVCLSESERRSISDYLVARSRDGTIPFEKFLRGNRYTNEKVYLEARNRYLQDDIRLGLFSKRKSYRRRDPIDRLLRADYDTLESIALHEFPKLLPCFIVEQLNLF